MGLRVNDSLTLLILIILSLGFLTEAGIPWIKLHCQSEEPHTLFALGSSNLRRLFVYYSSPEINLEDYPYKMIHCLNDSTSFSHLRLRLSLLKLLIIFSQVDSPFPPSLPLSIYYSSC